ncbi:MAG: hypothetical protein IJ088_15725, partial [Clostridia bacterium]|nr:hypothetical protein [Clostridia bacterium]
MSNETRLVDIPAYAKLNKRGKYYALKKNMPYFADCPDERGYLVIGKPSDVPGKMIPDSWTYDYYCAEDSYARKLEAKRIREEEEAAREKEEAERRAEMESNFGEFYISLSEVKAQFDCYPVNGFLLERFFDETGLGEILDHVFRSGKAFLLKLSSGLLAYNWETLYFEGLNEYPMKKHMLREMDREMTSRIWASIDDQEIRQVFEAWIEKVKPESVSASSVRSRMTLYHDDYSDSMGESFGFFSSRIRRGTKYHPDFLFYRDGKSGMLLSFEYMKYSVDIAFDWEKSHEVYTIENSDYPACRNATFHSFYPPNLYNLPFVAKDKPSTFCIHPSQHPDNKEISKKLKKLAELPVVSGYRILKWEGSWNDTNGTWILAELVSRRKDIEAQAGHILKNEKRRLEAMSYFPAMTDHASCYFIIEKESDESDIFDTLPFTVKSRKGATKQMEQDYGRFLFFTTEGDGSVDRDELNRQIWYEEDLIDRYCSYMNQGETTGLTDEYFSALKGRELPMFLASMYREWIFSHIGDLFDSENERDWIEVTPFLRKASHWRCRINPDGTVIPTPMDEKLEALLKRFNVTPDDITGYLSSVIRQEDYFS